MPMHLHCKCPRPREENVEFPRCAAWDFLVQACRILGKSHSNCGAGFSRRCLWHSLWDVRARQFGQGRLERTMGWGPRQQHRLQGFCFVHVGGSQRQDNVMFMNGSQSNHILVQSLPFSSSGRAMISTDLHTLPLLDSTARRCPALQRPETCSAV
jgi:hypothetical protein